jgi:hypothetical protein
MSEVAVEFHGSNNLSTLALSFLILLWLRHDLRN